jgi:hypothetical protein
MALLLSLRYLPSTLLRAMKRITHNVERRRYRSRRIEICSLHIARHILNLHIARKAPSILWFYRIGRDGILE